MIITREWIERYKTIRNELNILDRCQWNVFDLVCFWLFRVFYDYCFLSFQHFFLPHFIFQFRIGQSHISNCWVFRQSHFIATKSSTFGISNGIKVWISFTKKICAISTWYVIRVPNLLRNLLRAFHAFVCIYCIYELLSFKPLQDDDFMVTFNGIW